MTGGVPLSAPLDLFAVMSNTGNGDTGPAWAVALFVAGWVVLASFVVHGKLRQWRRDRDRRRTARGHGLQSGDEPR